MGLISRHANSPYTDGETLYGADLEQDISSAYNEANGSLSDINVASGADIAASKLADGTITNGKLASQTITMAKASGSPFSSHGFGSNFPVGATAVTGSWANIQTADITTGDGPGPVLIYATLSFTINVYTPHVLKVLEVRLTRDGTDLLGGSSWYGGNSDANYAPSTLAGGAAPIRTWINRWRLVTVHWVDTAATASTTHTYALQVQGDTTGRIRQRTLCLVELKL